MVPRNSANISEYVVKTSSEVAAGANQLALSAGAPATTGTDEPFEKCIVVPASTVCLPGLQNTEPFTLLSSIRPRAANFTVSLTCRITGVSTVTVLAVVNVGGSRSDRAVMSPPRRPPLPTNSTHSTSVGAAMANSFSQYWKACTTVIARMPPPKTLMITTIATNAEPHHVGTHGRMFL